MRLWVKGKLSLKLTLCYFSAWFPSKLLCKPLFIQTKQAILQWWPSWEIWLGLETPSIYKWSWDQSIDKSGCGLPDGMFTKREYGVQVFQKPTFWNFLLGHVIIHVLMLLFLFPLTLYSDTAFGDTQICEISFLQPFLSVVGHFWLNEQHGPSDAKHGWLLPLGVHPGCVWNGGCKISFEGVCSTNLHNFKKRGEEERTQKQGIYPCSSLRVWHCENMSQTKSWWASLLSMFPQRRSCMFQLGICNVFCGACSFIFVSFVVGCSPDFF